MENKISRFKAREQGFFLVFEREFNEGLLTDIIESAELSRDLMFDDYAKEIALGVENTEDELCELIETHLKKGWSIDRISKVSLAILKVALYEIKFSKDMPASIAINEAVELAKKYTVDESKFVNGVLGAIVRDMK